MTLTLAKIEDLAPDQAALDAARKLLKPATWPLLAMDGAGFLWGECQGSGASPYRVIVCEDDGGAKCSCPSRKFPCKHGLALMWLRADGKTSFVTAPRPDFVEEWIGRRRGSAAAPPKEKPRASMEAEAPPPDPKDEAKAEAARARNRAAREASVRAGLDELDQWLADQIDIGLAGFPAAAAQKCEKFARRLVDAKAGGLAARIEAFPAAMLALPEAERAGFALEAMAQWRLIAQAYRRAEKLPPLLAADARLAVGWPMTREALLADPSAPRAKGRWFVAATLAETQPDRLRRLETWLARLDGGAPCFAVLIDFVPLAGGANLGFAYAPGESFEAELAYYPSQAPLRAIVAAQNGATTRDASLRLAPRHDLCGALDAYEEALARAPWLGAWPLALEGAELRGAGDALWLCDGGTALPLQGDAAAPLVGIGPLAMFGLWNGRRFTPALAETALGRWVRP